MSAERTKLYEEAQVVFKKEAPWATLDHSTEFVPMSAKVSGFVRIRSAFTASMALISPNKQIYAKMPGKTGRGRRSGVIPDRRTNMDI
jgi:hypothetical protein